MEKISIAQLKEMILARVANPQQYKGKTLVLWDCDYTPDSVLYRVIEDVCTDYNDAHPEEDGAWTKYSDHAFITDDYTPHRVLCGGIWEFSNNEYHERFKYRNKGILLQTGCCVTINNEALLDFINTHVNQQGPLSENWAMVACAHSEKKGITPEKFGPNCEIYELDFGVEEWGEFLIAHRYNKAICRSVMAYVKDNGYRIPVLNWMRAIKALSRKMKRTNIPKLAQMPKADFDDAVKLRGGNNFLEFRKVMDDFYTFVTQ